MTAYYNEHDEYAAGWLRNLIKAGHIAYGHVDSRSIVDVAPSDLAGFTQCHFFAGIGVWSYALRGASWPDDRPVWTGSCPCQPFSQAGAGGGFADERHLWPHFHHLIRVCRPPVIFGEQVASPDGLGWLDLVQADMEAEAYAFAAFDLCAAGFGAPHIRQRLYWVANTDISARGQRREVAGGGDYRSDALTGSGFGRGGFVGELADADNSGLEGRQPVRQRADQCFAGTNSVAGGVANSYGTRHEGLQRQSNSRMGRRRDEERAQPGFEPSVKAGDASPTDGFWRDADWLLCRDGKWRPVEPGTFPLAHGVAGRVGQLRAYGNAIVAPQARAFIKAYLEI